MKMFKMPWKWVGILMVNIKIYISTSFFLEFVIFHRKWNILFWNEHIFKIFIKRAGSDWLLCFWNLRLSMVPCGFLCGLLESSAETSMVFCVPQRSAIFSRIRGKEDTGKIQFNYNELSWMQEIPTKTQNILIGPSKEKT